MTDKLKDSMEVLADRLAKWREAHKDDEFSNAEILHSCKAWAVSDNIQETGLGDAMARAALLIERLITKPAVEAAEIEVAAREIYESWEAIADYVPWVVSGNSTMQDSARRLARRILAGVNQPSEFYVESDLLRSALGFCGIAAPESDEELGFNSASYAKKVVRKLAKIDMAGGVNQQAGSGVPEYGSYTTTPGESVAGIALRQLKDESRWVDIRDLNAHAFPCIQAFEYYPVGTVLRMPLPPSPAAKAVKS